jgi:hypothetical protein
MRNRSKTNDPGKLKGNSFSSNLRQKLSPRLLRIMFTLTLSVFLFLPTYSQPSGGPYGPVYTKYEIPKDAVHIFYVSPNGDVNKTGNSLNEPTTLEEAIRKAATGDAIILRGGTYRTGNLIYNQGITLQPYADEQPVLKGTFEAKEWKDLHNGLWKTTWTNLFPSKPASWWGKDRSGKLTPLHRFNDDMVFINGKFLHSAGWEGEVDENSFFIDYERQTVFIGTDPTNKIVEITAFNGALIRTTGECNGKKSDGKGPVIKGITFTQYAYRALEIEGAEPEGLADEKNFGKDVVGTLIENCTITFCSRVAGYLRGDNMVIRNCKVSDTSTEGIYVIASNDVLLEKNIFARNNIEDIDGYFPAAVKIFNQCHRLTCRDNLVTDLPNSNGIWYDVGNVDGRFINNWIENVGFTDYKISTKSAWPSQNGFFFEISKGVICAGNVFVNCDHGMLILNSCDALVYQNTFVNSMACFGRDGRSAQGDHFGWHPSTGPDVDKREGHVFVNNLMSSDQNFDRPLLFVWQPDFLCEKLKTSPLKELDNNVFIQNSEIRSMPLILWTPVSAAECQLKANSLADLQIYYPGFNKNSLSIEKNVSFFKSPDLGNYQLVKGFPGEKCAAKLPEAISSLLGMPKKAAPYIGAYPLIPL